MKLNKQHSLFSLSITLILCLFSTLFAEDMELIDDFGENPGHLRMYVHVPTVTEREKPMPLVLILHGSWQTAKVLAKASGFNTLADSLKFIALYPDQPFYNNLLTSFSFYIPGKMRKDAGETASIRHMINYACDTYPVDTNRIFITGMSAGGAMSNVMLNAYPSLFAAGALFAAPSNLYEDINPRRDPDLRVAVIHGRHDLTVPFRHAIKIEKQWREYFGLDEEALVTENYLGHAFLTLSMRPAFGLPRLLRLDLDNTGHILLVDVGKGLKQGGQYTLFTQDRDFHLPYWICEFFGLTSE